MKNVAVLLVILVGIGTIAVTYRAYRTRAEAHLAAQRASIEERESEKRHRDEARQEALRLKELQAQQEAAAAERTIEELRAQQAAADAANAQREAQAARWQAELDRLRQEKTAIEGEARQLADMRREDIAKIERAEADTMARMRGIELERVNSQDRDAARAAALAHQIEVEKRAREQLARLRTAPQQ